MNNEQRRLRDNKRVRKYYSVNKSKVKLRVVRWRSKRSEEEKEITRKKRRDLTIRLRELVIEKLGGKCCKCNADDRRVLCIDHVHGGGNVECSKINYINYLKKVLADISNKYQLLCHNCNWIKRHDNREVPIPIIEKHRRCRDESLQQ